MKEVDKRRMCPHCRAFITTDDKVCPYCDTPVGPRAIDLRSPGNLLGGMVPSAQFATTLILTINVVLFLVTVIASMKSGLGGLMGIDGITRFRFGATHPVAVLMAGQWWRLVTAGFLHGDLMHIGFNCWAMMDIGAHAEEVYGTRRLTVIYLVASVGGFLASVVLGGHSSVGASAGVFGLLGAMVAVGVLHKRSSEAAAIKAYYLRWAIYGFFLSMLMSRNVDNWAHAGGFAAGFAAAWLAGTPRVHELWRERMWLILCCLATGITALCFLKMYLQMSVPLY